jgi:hypothetical protein
MAHAGGTDEGTWFLRLILSSGPSHCFIGKTVKRVKRRSGVFVNRIAIAHSDFERRIKCGQMPVAHRAVRCFLVLQSVKEIAPKIPSRTGDFTSKRLLKHDVEIRRIESASFVNCHECKCSSSARVASSELSACP